MDKNVSRPRRRHWSYHKPKMRVGVGFSNLVQNSLYLAKKIDPTKSTIQQDIFFFTYVQIKNKIILKNLKVCTSQIVPSLNSELYTLKSKNGLI